MSHPLIDGLGISPDVFIHQFDVAGDRALLVRLSAEQLRAASFLDERVLGPDVVGGWAPWEDIVVAVKRAPPADARFIFHVGHCGSTLISRLVEETAGVRSLREPLALRQFAQIAADADDGAALWTDAMLRKRMDIFLRVASAGRPTIVKPTSWCGDLAPRVTGKAILVYAKPDVYIATMIGAANNPIDLRLNAPLRLRRLRRRYAAPIATLSALSIGEIAAMSWASEAAALDAAAASAPERFRPLDFDAFLRGAEEGLAFVLDHFTLVAPGEKVRAALAGPLMRTYSKDSSFDYSPEDRRRFLAEYRAANADEVRRGLRWLDETAKAHPAIASALARFGA